MLSERSTVSVQKDIDMKKYFKLSFIHYLLYTEYYAMLIDVFRRAKIEKIEDEVVKKVVLDAKKHMPTLSRVVEKTRMHSNSSIIEEIALERRRMIGSLRHGIKAGQYAETPEQREAWRLLNNWMRQEKTVMRSQSTMRYTGMLLRMDARLQASPALQKSMMVLGLEARFAKIMEMTERIFDLFTHRISDVNAFAEMSKELRRKSHESLLIMLRTLEMWANIEGDHQDFYHVLCSNIASAMGETHKSYKFRKTMKKKKDEKEKRKNA